MKEKILTIIFGKTESGERYTFRQWLVYVWFAVSLFLLASTADTAPLWLFGLFFVSFAVSANQLNKLPLPADPEEEQDDDEEE